MVKGHCSIYTKVSLPCQVRFRRGNVTKIELALPLLSLSPPQYQPTFRHFRRFLMSRRINASENRESAPEKTGYTRVIFKTLLSRLFDVTFWPILMRNRSLEIIPSNLSSLFFLQHIRTSHMSKIKKNISIIS